jgi:hypothetical protein
VARESVPPLAWRAWCWAWTCSPVRPIRDRRCSLLDVMTARGVDHAIACRSQHFQYREMSEKCSAQNNTPEHPQAGDRRFELLLVSNTFAANSSSVSSPCSTIE